MPLQNYTLLKGRVIASRPADEHDSHYQIWLRAGDEDWRIAVNTCSRQNPSELLFGILDPFWHAVCPKLHALAEGRHDLTHLRDLPALDYVRGGLLRRDQLSVIPCSLPGPDNDSNDKLHLFIREAIENPEVQIYAFGETWGPQEHRRDYYFDFHPGAGMHDVHMNQGNDDRFRATNGTWQDGALMLQRPDNSWSALFIAFQSQSWRTDDATGQRSHP